MKLPFTSPPDQSQTIGQRAEDFAYNYLKKKGLKAVERNYSCRFGEVDLIMLDQESLVFIEVRYRKSACFGTSAETVTTRKQEKIAITAQHFIHTQKKYQKHACRFDVIALAPHQHAINKYELDWIKNAFTLEL